jgi:hypothetical protein
MKICPQNMTLSLFADAEPNWCRKTASRNVDNYVETRFFYDENLSALQRVYFEKPAAQNTRFLSKFS